MTSLEHRFKSRYFSSWKRRVAAERRQHGGAHGCTRFRYVTSNPSRSRGSVTAPIIPYREHRRDVRCGLDRVVKEWKNDEVRTGVKVLAGLQESYSEVKQPTDFFLKNVVLCYFLKISAAIRGNELPKRMDAESEPLSSPLCIKDRSSPSG